MSFSVLVLLWPRRRRWLALVLSTLLALSAPSYADEYDELCTGVNYEEYGQQLFYYCQSAKSAKQSKKPYSILVKTWTAVAVVCGIACASKGYDWAQTAELACAGSVVGGNLTEIGVALAHKDKLKGIASAIGTIIAGNIVQSVITNTVTSNYSCASTGTAALIALVKSLLAKQHKDTYNDNLESARSLMSQAATVEPFSAATISNQTTGEPGGAAGSSFGSNGSTSSSGGTINGPESCNSEESLLQCAAARDDNINRFLGDNPDFEEQFRELTGQNLRDFLSSEEQTSGPGPSDLAAFAAPGDVAAQNEIDEAVRQMYDELIGGEGLGNSAYRGAGSGGSDKSLSFSGDLGLKKIGHGLGAANRRVAHKKRLRFKGISYNDVFNDRTHNIFERVSARYQQQSRDM